MDLQMSMKIDGVVGPSTNSDYKGWSEIISWTWGMMSNRKTMEITDSNKTTLNEISVVKPIGIDSPAIRLLFAQGESIPNIEISITPVRGKKDASKKLMHMKLEDVMIKSIVSGGNVDDDIFKENISFIFDRVSFEYSKTGMKKEDGEYDNTDYDFCWNVSENKEWNKESE